MKKLYCITCPEGCHLTVTGSDDDMVIEGNKCDNGLNFANAEMTAPTRTLTTTVRTNFPGVPVISVRTDGEIPKDMLMEAMAVLSEIVIEEELSCGDVLLEDIAETGVSVIVTSSALMQLGAELENKNVQLGKRGSGESSEFIMEDDPDGVRIPLILDNMGIDAAGDFIGTAGEAVGVEGLADEDEQEVEEVLESDEVPVKPRGRPHIKR
ncbi:MAG: DUF1667 domain-containing protein [Oscillospiraceae bacterium]|jgi:CxxC motif-containing protein|nr:DUF1667 domain-containing protein [Oscillospiraceae bacterium]